MTLAGKLETQVHRLGCSTLLCLLVIFSSITTPPALVFSHPGLVPPGPERPSLGTKQEEMCTGSALPAIKFATVAGIGFIAGGALTIKEPLASALLHAL